MQFLQEYLTLQLIPFGKASVSLLNYILVSKSEGNAPIGLLTLENQTLLSAHVHLFYTKSLGGNLYSSK